MTPLDMQRVIIALRLTNLTIEDCLPALDADTKRRLYARIDANKNLLLEVGDAAPSSFDPFTGT